MPSLLSTLGSSLYIFYSVVYAPEYVCIINLSPSLIKHRSRTELMNIEMLMGNFNFKNFSVASPFLF